MTEAAGTLVIGATASTLTFTSLALYGLDVPSLGAAMLGCVVVQTLLPSESVNPKVIVATTIGSMLFASFASPFIVPMLAKLTPEGVAIEHLRASAAALVAGFPKPLLLFIRSRWQKATGAEDVA